jgi:hypothetical protein
MHPQEPPRRIDAARTSIYITFDYAATSYVSPNRGQEPPRIDASVYDRLLPQEQESVHSSP